MLGSIIMIGDQDDERSNLNSKDSRINRGIELLLRNRRRESLKSKMFKVCFGKMISLFKREFHFYFEISLDIRKQNSQEK